jgi:hypothetical protein
MRNRVAMKPSSKNEPVIREKEIIVPLDPAHEEKPTLVERERIEKEQAEKEENQLTIHKEEAVVRYLMNRRATAPTKRTKVRKTRSLKERRS